MGKDELFSPGNRLYGRPFTVSKFSAGYIYDIPAGEHLMLGMGGLASLYGLPSALKPSYGSTPVSFMLFVRAMLM